MLIKIKLKDMIQLTSIVVIFVVIGYFYAHREARNTLWQKFYPIRAKLSVRQMTCSADSPSWMKDILIHQTLNNNAPANQIAYIDRQGRLFHCENGYIGEYPLLSKPIDEHTRFRLASVTKLWTSDAILDLIKQGKLDFDTKLVDVLTEIKNPADKRINDITIRQLLLHRAGFDRYRVLGQDMFGLEEPICPNQIDKMNRLYLGFTPNEKNSYSNLGYCLLGEIVKRTTHQSYVKYIQNTYHLENTSLKFIVNEKMEDEVSYNYSEQGLTGAGDIFTAFDYKLLDSSAGLSGNAIDIVKQVRPMLLKSEPNITSKDMNLNCSYNTKSECYGYAMVSQKKDIKDKEIYFKDGSLFAVSSLVGARQDGSVIALLSNGDPSSKASIDNLYELLSTALNK